MKNEDIQKFLKTIKLLYYISVYSIWGIVFLVVLAIFTHFLVLPIGTIILTFIVMPIKSFAFWKRDKWLNLLFLLREEGYIHKAEYYLAVRRLNAIA